MARFPSTIVMLALCVLVSACASEKPQVTRIPNAEGGGITIFETGGGTTDVGPAAVFSDDSSAHLVGRNILTKGGSAIDAVVGMVMASSVSAPHVAGLGAGGQCLVYRADDHRAYAIDFVRHDGGTQRPELLPAMLTLHANFGRLPWGEVSASAQHLARFGAPISKELHTALSQHQDRLLQDAMMRKLYFSDNKPLRIGTFVTQARLSETLSAIRKSTTRDFLGLQTATLLHRYYQEIDPAVSIDMFDKEQVAFAEPITTVMGNDTVFLPVPAINQDRATIAAELATLAKPFTPATSPALRINQTIARQIGLVALATPEIPDEALADWMKTSAAPQLGFAATDNAAISAACVISLGTPFGHGRYSEDLGFIPGFWPQDSFLLPPMILANGQTKLFKATVIGAQSLSENYRAIAFGLPLNDPRAYAATPHVASFFLCPSGMGENVSEDDCAIAIAEQSSGFGSIVR